MPAEAVAKPERAGDPASWPASANTASIRLFSAASEEGVWSQREWLHHLPRFVNMIITDMVTHAASIRDAPCPPAARLPKTASQCIIQTVSPAAEIDGAGNAVAGMGGRRSNGLSEPGERAMTTEESIVGYSAEEPAEKRRCG
jgi:hypothetical protein